MVGSECALKPAPFPHISSVLGVVLIPDGKRCVSSADGNLATAVLSPGGVFVSGNKHNKEANISQFYVFLAHAHLGVLKFTVQQHGIRLVGELAPCSGCSQAKGVRAATPHHTTARARAPMEWIHLDTAGSYMESLGGSRYVIMFVDSTSRLQRPYETWHKNSPAVLAVVKFFVADMGAPRAFRTDDGSDNTSPIFVEYCDGLRIYRKLTAPYTP